MCWLQNGYLTSLSMEVDYDSEVLRYVYKCGNPTLQSHSPRCEERQTEKAESENYFLPALRHHRVLCNTGEALSKFYLRVGYEGPGYVWYFYTCCTI